MYCARGLFIPACLSFSYLYDDNLAMEGKEALGVLVSVYFLVTTAWYDFHLHMPVTGYSDVMLYYC